MHYQLVTHQLLTLCPLFSKIDLKKKEDYELFKFYWDVLLARGAPKGSWTETIRQCTTPMQAVTRNKYQPNKPAFVPGVEAFIVVMVENCYDKWPKCVAWKAENGNERLPSRTKQNEEDTKFLKAKYSDSTAGQKSFCGWSVEGLDRHDEIKEMIAEARRKDLARYEKVEADFLAKWRKTDLNLPEQVSEDSGKKKKKGKKTKQHPERKRKRTIDLDL